MTNQHCFPSQKCYVQEGQESGECFLLFESYPTTVLLCRADTCRDSWRKVYVRYLSLTTPCTPYTIQTQNGTSLYSEILWIFEAIPVAMLFKAWVCDSLIARIAVSNPADGMDVVGLVCVSM